MSANMFEEAFRRLDEEEERKNPGHLARRAAAQEQERRDRLERRRQLVEIHGSVEAVSDPIEQERAIIAATAHLTKKVRKRFANGVFTVDAIGSWTGLFDKIPAGVQKAVLGALPAPRSIREARIECEFWEARDHDIDVALCDEPSQADSMLGLHAFCRYQILTTLYWHDLPIVTIDDLRERLRLFASQADMADAADMKAMHEAFDRLFPEEAAI